MSRLLGFAALALIVYWTFAFVAQRSTLFPAPRLPPGTAAPPFGGELMWLGVDRNVEAWYFAAPNSGPAPAIVFAHGNGELIDYWAEAFQVPRRWGYAVLLVEYPGYGRSGGKPSQDSIVRVMAEAYDTLAARPDVDPTRIVGYGRSLGGGVVTALSAQRPLAALVLESSFASVTRMARAHGVPPFLVRDPFDSAPVLEAFDGPVLILHGERDRIVPAAHARLLADAAVHSELQLLPCGHNDCPRPWDRIRPFVAAHAPP